MEPLQINRYNQIIKVLILFGDLFIVNSLFCLLFSSLGKHLELRLTLPQILLIISLCYLAFFVRGGIVVYRRRVYAYQILRRVFCNVFFFSVLVGIVLEIGNFAHVFSLFYLVYIISLFLAISGYHLFFRWLIKEYRHLGGNLRHAVLVGSTDNNKELYHELTDDSTSGYRVHGYFDYKPNTDFPETCPYLGTPDKVEVYLSKHPFIEQLYCCLPSQDRSTIIAIIDYCENHLVHFFSVPNVRNYLQNRMYMTLIGSVPVLSLRRDPLRHTENRVVKRTFDILFSVLFLCTLFPFIFLFVSIGIKLTMPGPVFFLQKRNGLNDKEFYCIKFRSMKVNQDADKLQCTKNDPRKTKFGNFLRRSNLDETPQFINVLLGHMSVVGPRPHMVKHTEEYSNLIDKYMVRHFVKPGITGWSQVTGFRGETKELCQMEGRVKGDIWYIEHWSFWLDLVIIYKTIANVFKGEEKAY